MGLLGAIAGRGGGGPVKDPPTPAAVTLPPADRPEGPPRGGTSPENGDCVPPTELGVAELGAAPMAAAPAVPANRRLGEPGPDPSIGPRVGIEKAELDTAPVPNNRI